MLIDKASLGTWDFRLAYWLLRIVYSGIVNVAGVILKSFATAETFSAMDAVRTVTSYRINLVILF